MHKGLSKDEVLKVVDDYTSSQPFYRKIEMLANIDIIPGDNITVEGSPITISGQIKISSTGGGGGGSTVAGTTNRIVVTGTTTQVIDIAPTYVGQSSITTLGTITTGAWSATPIADSYISSAATWNAKQSALSGTGFVKVSGTTISYDNSTYLTTSSAASTYVSLSGSYSNPSWITSLAWSKITSTPTTLSGYGITDPIVVTSGSYANPSWITSLAYSKLTGVPSFITLSSLSGTSPITYNSSTGAIGINQATTSTNGYLSSTDWNTFNGKQGAITLTTTGTSGAATLVGNTLNIPNYSTGGGSGSPGGSNTQVQYNNSGSFGGAAKTTIDSTDGNMVVGSMGATVPGTPTSGAKLYDIGDDLRLMTSYGSPYPFQPSMGYKVFSGICVGSSAITYIGGWTATWFTTGGSPTLSTANKGYDNVNMLPNYTCLRWTTPTTANSFAELYISNMVTKGALVGNSPIGGGGARLQIGFGLFGYVASSTQRFFAGYINTNSALGMSTDITTANVNHLIGITKNSGENVFKVCYNNGVAVQTVSTGITISANDLYRVTIYFPPDGSFFRVIMESFSKTTGYTVYDSGKLTTSIPSQGISMNMHTCYSNGTSGVAIGLSIINMWEELN